MPAKRPAKTSRAKLWLHTFYLCQPFLQFVALIAVMLVLARCSPLAPSTNKNGGLNVSPTGENGSELAEAEAQEQAIQNSLKELNITELEVISEQEQEGRTQNVPQADLPLEEKAVQDLSTKRNNPKLKTKPRVLYVPLEAGRLESFFANGYLRIDISERLEAHSKEKARKALLRLLSRAQESQELGASAMLVLPDQSVQALGSTLADLNVRIKVSLSLPSEEKAYLEIRRVDEADANQNNAALLNLALKDALQLAILLE